MIASSLKDSEGEQTVDLLLQKDAEVNVQSSTGLTALHLAASKDNLDIARKLIAHNASTRLKDKRGQLPLHRAAAVGSLPIVNLLLENKSPLNASDVDGLTALHHAISEGHGDAALALLKAGAETDKKDMDGRLAIDSAPDSMVNTVHTTKTWDCSNMFSGQKVHPPICGAGGHRYRNKLTDKT
jgi:26S proteasome non-ATPase regulatory subunit 10